MSAPYLKNPFLLKRGTTAKVAAYSGPEGELVIDTTKGTIAVQTGTSGGVVLARLSDIPNKLSQLQNDLGLTTYSAGTGLNLANTTFSVASTPGSSVLSWGTEVTLGTVGGLAIKAKLPANPNTDTLVIQSVVSGNATYPILLAATADAAANIGAAGVQFASGVKVNPSTSTITATTFDGTATRATADANGKNIVTTYATKEEIASIRNGILVTTATLPATGESGKIYFVPNGASKDQNTYTEYAWVNDAWEILGLATIDLSEYIKTLSISGYTITYTKGDGTTGTLVTTDTKYSAGTGLNLAGTTFSVASTAGTSTLAWGTEVTLGTVGGLAIKAKLPANPNSDTLVTQNVSTSNVPHPLLLCPTANATVDQGAKTAIFTPKVKINPTTGELALTGANAHIRQIAGDYGVFWRNDGEYYYLLQTGGSGDGYGSWNTARPLILNLSTGICSINGNAATATKFAANQPITLTGDVTGTVSSQAGWTIPVKRRSATVGQSTSTNTKPWYKFASSFALGSFVDYRITFLVEQVYGSKNWGILRCHVRSGEGGVFSYAYFDFAVNVGLPIDDFVMVHQTTANSIVELWVKVTTGWQGYRFTVLSEGISGSDDITWTLHNTWSAGSEETYSEGIAATATNAVLANGATYDSAGNKIVDTYAPMSWVVNKLRVETERMSGGRCTVVYDDNGNPNYMVVIPRFRLEDVFGTSDYGTGQFGVFNVNGSPVTEILLGQYYETNIGGKACSLPRKNPWTNITFDNAVAACRAKGANWTIASNQLWFARILWVQKHKGDENRIWHGNTNYGRDAYDKKETGTFVTATTKLPGDTSISDPVTLTGSGPLTWYDDESPWGVADAAGNILGWFSGARIAAGGEINIIWPEDALLHDADFSANSTLWKAIMPNGASVTPGTEGTIKVDGVAPDTTTRWANVGRFRLNTVVENPSVNGYFACNFENISVKEGITLPAVLVRHGLYPYSGATNYLCNWYTVNTIRENLCFRGSNWRGTDGPLPCSLNNPRTASGRNVGFRSAFVSYS